jgi:hypothetical protein
MEHLRHQRADPQSLRTQGDLMPEYPYHDAYVRKLSIFRYQGQCRCRWQGPIRLTHAKAASDCLQHEL